MSTNWQLVYNGVSQPPSAWGVTLASLSLVSQEADTLELEIKGGAVESALTFVFGSTVDLYKDGTRIFSGTVTKTPISGQVSSETNKYIVSGPWWWFKNVVYQQPRQIAFQLVPNGPVALSTQFSSRITLFSDPGATTHLDPTNQISSAVSWAVQAASAPINPVVQYNTNGITPPWETMVDATVESVIRRCLSWLPDSVTWFDYSATPPVFHVAQRSKISAVSLDVSQENLIEGLDVTRRDDIVPDGVLFYFEGVAIFNGVQYTSLTNQQAGTTNGPNAKKVIVHTFSLSNAATSQPEPIPLNLASSFYAYINTVHYECELTLHEQEVSFAAGVGKNLNLTNSRSEWATMNALIQEARFDFVNGKTQVKCGPPVQLNPQDFLAILQATTQAQNQTNFPGGAGGPVGPKNPPQPPGPPRPPGPGNFFQSQELQVCQDGVPTTITVLTG